MTLPTHKHSKVNAWLARRPRCHLHFTPTHASWINQVERWFGLVTQRAVRHGCFSSVEELTCKINAFAERHNAPASPFAWGATVESIIARIERRCSLSSETQHQP